MYFSQFTMRVSKKKGKKIYKRKRDYYGKVKDKVHL